MKGYTKIGCDVTVVDVFHKAMPFFSLNQLQDPAVSGLAWSFFLQFLILLLKHCLISRVSAEQRLACSDCGVSVDSAFCWQQKIIVLPSLSLLFPSFLALVVIYSTNTSIVHITKHWGAFVQPLLEWKSNNYYIFWVCVCNLSCPACNAHVPYCHLWLPGCTILSPYLMNRMIFRKKIPNIKFVV